MSKIKVIFRDVDEVNEFVNIVNKYPVKMALQRGHLRVGATSILGIIYLGISKVMSLNVPEEIIDTLKGEIQQFIAV